MGAFPKTEILQYARLNIQPVQQRADVDYDGLVCGPEPCLGINR